MMSMLQTKLTLYPHKVVKFLSRVMSSSLGADHLQRTSSNSRDKEVTQAEIVEIKDLSKSVKHLKLHVDNKQFTFKAGQWVDMFIPGVNTVGGFSMSSPPHFLTEASMLHLAIKFSQHPPALWVHTKCQVGSTVQLRAGGDFFYCPSKSSEPRDLLLLAGGVGVNPLFSMLQHFVHCQDVINSFSKKDRSASMFFSARNEEELVFKDDLLKIAQTAQNVNVKLFSSRERPSNSDAILNRRIQQKDIQSIFTVLDPKATDVYLCGPLPFIETMKTYCIASNIPPECVHYERWW